MTEAKTGQEIDIKDIKKKKQEVREKSQELLSLLDEKFMGVEGRRIIGQTLLGSPARDDGKEWTMEDLDSGIHKLTVEQESSTRKHLAKDMITVIEAQAEFFQKTEHPMQQASDANIEFAVALMERVLASDEEITERYPIFTTEIRAGAEALEVMRRLVLKPTYLLIEIPRLDDQFVEERETLITDEMRDESITDSNRYWQLEAERIKKVLKARTEEEWLAIADEEREEFRTYLNYCLGETVNKNRETLNFASRLVDGGKKIFSDDTITQGEKEVEELESINRELTQIPDLEGVLTWIKNRFGEKASFRDLLQFLNPIRLEPQTVQKADEEFYF